MPKLFDAFNKAPLTSPLKTLLIEHVPSYSEEHRARAEQESINALKTVLSAASLATVYKNSGNKKRNG